MKGLLIISFLLLVGLNGFGQNPVNEYYKGMKDGTYRDYYENGNIKIKYVIKNGNADGTHLNYYKSGKLKSSDNFDNGHFDGVNFELNEDGDTTLIEVYKKDTLLEYKEIDYYGSRVCKKVNHTIFTNHLKSYNPFENTKNKEHSLTVTYDINKLKQEVSNTNTLKEYYKNKQLKFTGTIVNDGLHGEFVYYSKQGAILKKEIWKNGGEIEKVLISQQPPLISQTSKDYYKSAKDKIDIGEYLKAIDDLNIAIDLSPDYELAYLNRGVAKFLLLEYEEACIDFTKIIVMNPTSDDAYYNRGFVKFRLEDFKGAKEDFDITLKLNKNFIDAYAERGQTNLKLGFFEDAIKDYNEYEKFKGESFEILTNKAVAKKNLKDYEGAFEDISKALKLNPNSAKIIGNRGTCYFETGQNEEALADYNKAIELEPELSSAYYGRGLVKFEMDDKMGACVDLEKAFELGYNEASKKIKEYCNQ